MKKLTSVLTLCSVLVSGATQAAQELNAEQAEKLKHFKEVSVRGQYRGIPDFKRAANEIADKNGAAYFFITDVMPYNASGYQKVVYANLYKADAPEIEVKNNFQKFNGVYEYPKLHAFKYEPFKVIRVFGYYPTLPEMMRAVGKEAKEAGAYAFYIDKTVEFGANQELTVFLFKKDAELRKIQSDDLIPYDSEEGQRLLAQGGDAALQVENPGYYSSTAFNEYTKGVPEKTVTAPVVNATTTSTATTPVTTATQASTMQKATVTQGSGIKRYTVTDESGSKVQELNDATALKMIPYKTINFRGYFPNTMQISKAAADRALADGAKFFHISRVAQDTKGPNKTIYVELYR